MRTRLKLNPGQRGTKKLLRQYGSQLICVRYRYDEEKKRRYKTVELIVDEVPWEPKEQGPEPAWNEPSPHEEVHIRIDNTDRALRERLKAAHGRWNLHLKFWTLPYREVVAMGLKDRIIR
jgi:hypothetical protein